MLHFAFHLEPPIASKQQSNTDALQQSRRRPNFVPTPRQSSPQQQPTSGHVKQMPTIGGLLVDYVVVVKSS
jgi:hypothetical protein